MSATQTWEGRPYWSDSILEEIWQIRDEHAKKFNYDLKAICDDIYAKQEEREKQGFKYVTEPLKKLGDD